MGYKFTLLSDKYKIAADHNDNVWMISPDNKGIHLKDVYAKAFMDRYDDAIHPRSTQKYQKTCGELVDRLAASYFNSGNFKVINIT